MTTRAQRTTEVLAPASPEAPWCIERLVPGGEGFARLPDGRVGFASGALPGDSIQPDRIEEHRSFRRAVDWRLEVASPDRVRPPCPVADRCGGCDWMALARPQQQVAKAELVREALRRTARITPPPDFRLVTVGPDLGYRQRVRLHVDEEGQLGFRGRGSHRIVTIEGCPVAVPAIQGAIGQLKALLGEHPRFCRSVESIELRAADSEPQLTLELTLREKGAPPKDLVAILGGVGCVSLKGDPQAEAGRAQLQRYSLPGSVELQVEAGAFTQVNWEVNRSIVQSVLTTARVRQAHTFCDLYAGAGNFTLPLLAQGLTGVAIELEGASVRSGRRAALVQGLPETSFRAGPVERLARVLVKEGRRFDLVIVDPPRAGARDAIDAIVSLTRDTLLWCACDPVTFARDLASLLQRGLVLEHLVAYDMFPHTHHVEVLAELRVPK